MNGFKKFPPLVLAAVLQVMPLARTVYTAEVLPGCGFALLARWVVGGIAIFGYHAVSSASVTINSPTTATGTVGSNFTYRISTTTTYPEMLYSAAPTPAGVTGLTNSSNYFVLGIPTAPGVTRMTIMVSQTNYTTLTQVVTVTIMPTGPPTITSQPASLTNALGTTATFNVGVSNAQGHQWYFNSSPIANANAASLTLTNVQTTNAGSYYLIATNSLGSTNSVTVTLTVGSPPAISAQPQSQVSNQGSNVTFNVALAANAAPPNYQWYYGSSAIPGATGASYQITNVQGSNAGNYSVIVSNAFGIAGSSNAVLTIAGDFIFANHGTNNLTCPIYGPEPTNVYTSKTGNTSAGVPAGTQVYGGAKLSGSNYTAQLWGAAGANLPESALSPIPGTTTNFGGLPGNIANVPQNPVVPGAVEGSVATMELRVWNNQTNTVTNWSQVLANTNVDRGISPIFNSPPLGGVSAAPPLSGLVSFNTYFPSASGTQPVIVFTGSVSGGQISLMFNSVVGKTYTVQYEQILNDSWQTSAEFPATATNSVIMRLATNTTGFYRVYTSFP